MKKLFLTLITLTTSKFLGHQKMPQYNEITTLSDSEPKVLTSLKMFRHGARVPGGDPLRDWYLNAGYTYPKQLTKVGQKQNEKLGSKYLLKDSKILHNNTLIYSSPIQRCIDSAISFMKNYFKGEKKKIIVLKEDEVLKLMSVEKYEEWSDDYLDKVAEQESEHIDRLYDLALDRGLEDLMKVHCLKCELVPENSLDKIKNLKKMNTVYYCNSTNKLHYKDFKAPMIQILRRGAKILYFLQFNQKNFALYYSREVFKVLGSQIIKELKNIPDFKDKNTLDKYEDFKTGLKTDKNIFFFAHNKNIMGLLFALFDHHYLFNTELMMVKFVGDMSFELVKIGNNYFVEIFYMDKELFLEECGHTKCHYSEFLHVLDEKLRNLKKDELEDFNGSSGHSSVRCFSGLFFFIAFLFLF